MTEAPASARLHARAIEVGYRRRAVLDELTLTVPPGRFTALLGPNGSGKSTLLRALAGLTALRAGEVTLDGHAIHTLPRRRLAQQLSLLPQTPRAPDDIPVADLVAQGRYPHRRLFTRWSPQDQLICNEAMRLTDIDELATRPLGALSGGQRQRAWIAMTLAQCADILLLDEPTTYLDIAHQLDILNLLRRLVREQGKTIVAVLHDINHAARFADHICLLKEGRIIASGSADGVIRPDYLTEVFSIKTAILQDPLDGVPVCIARR
ncbi:iron complex transport system ATP-binding protein [Ancylobacter sp. 3268]|uniref:ABC transporter ATP-binding protein n=1 Tax=Ancylobacter sp. 3268 TaxID=2817752 RepID=UPI00285A4C67|nr:ABC transporter ATP-binding protein [Ancylobacter sp. 3268]MDR6951163.1 iron complex transport system ATP-binding protein [Ancylobacter sp. 3268]